MVSIKLGKKKTPNRLVKSTSSSRVCCTNESYPKAWCSTSCPFPAPGILPNALQAQGCTLKRSTFRSSLPGGKLLSYISNISNTMDHSSKLTELDPMPIWTPAPSDHGAQRSRSPMPYTGGFDGGPPEGMALHLGPEGHIPDHPGSVAEFGRPASQPMLPQQTFAPHMQEHEALDIRTLRQSCQYNLRGYMAVQQEYMRYGGNVADSRLRHQTGMVLGDLMTLQMEVRELAQRAQDHRWRKWLMGGIL